MNTTLPAEGPVAVLLQATAGEVIPLTEPGARRFLALLRAKIATADEGRDVTLDLTSADKTISLRLTSIQARGFADDIEAALSTWAVRSLARGRPIAQITRYERDEISKEIVKTETQFQY